MTTTEEEKIESLHRALDEIEVLEAIYGCCIEQEDESATPAFSIVTVAEHLKAKELTTSGTRGCGTSTSSSDSNMTIPQLEIELRIPIIINEDIPGEEFAFDTTIRCRLPPGYPLIPAVISITSLSALCRRLREELSKEVNQYAQELAGQEAILPLVEYMKEKVAESQVRDVLQAMECGDATDSNTYDAKESSKRGRRWIWVHHITDSARCKSIVQEAKELGLGGYLKPGYPGVVVVEGPSSRCDEFVTYIKGNKSRPGGFGRNWGHHVRGHIDFDTGIFGDGNDSVHTAKLHPRPQLPVDFEEIVEDLATLSKLCRECGLEDEFKEYVMQHKG